MTGLAPYLPNVISEALEATGSIQEEHSRATALSELTPYLSELASEALEIARSIQEGKERVHALAGLIPYVPEVAGEALDLTRSIQKESDRADALMYLGKYLPEVVGEALALAPSLSEFFRLRLLRGLSKYMPTEFINTALNVTRSLQLADRSTVLIDFAHHLPEEYRLGVLSEALEVTRSIPSKRTCAQRLSWLLSELKLIETDVLLWQEVLHMLANKSRSSFILDIPKLCPAILSLSRGDKISLQLVIKSMRDVCRQWL